MSKMSDALKINLCINASNVTFGKGNKKTVTKNIVMSDVLMHKLISNASDILDIIFIRFSLKKYKHWIFIHFSLKTSVWVF